MIPLNVCRTPSCILLEKWTDPIAVDEPQLINFNPDRIELLKSLTTFVVLSDGFLNFVGLQEALMQRI